MFWKFSYSASNIQTILEKSDVILTEILDEDDVIQECKSNNEKLVTFLTSNENLNQLISYVVDLPSEELGERLRFKYSTISSELLTCDISAINDSIISNKELIDKLYSFLHNDAPLNPLLASYFARVMGSLISRKTDLLLTYLQSKSDFVELILKHINTSAVMDVLLRLLTTIENNELKQRVLKWLTEINLIKNLISLFSHNYTNDVHSNVSQFLCDIIRISREQILAQRENQRDTASYNNSNDYSSSNMDSNQQNSQPITDYSSFTNPLLDTLETVEVIDQLLDYMFESTNSSNISLSSGIDVLLTILEPKTSTIEFIFESKNLEADRLFREQERYSIASRGIKNVSNACITRLKLLNELLINKNIQTIETVKMTYGELTFPLGSTRLNIIKLITKLIGTNNSKLNEEIVHFKILNTILDFVFTNKWNNFLHTQFFNLFSTLLNVNDHTPNITNSNNNSFNNNSNEENKVVNGENENNIELNRSVSIVLEHLLKECKLIERIGKAWSLYFESASYDQKTGSKSNNAGYIGHLTTMSNLISKNSREGKFSNVFQNYFNASKEISDCWKEFEETKLNEINRKNTQDLVRNPLISCSSADSNAETDSLELPSDENMQRKYADYNKDMISSFPDSFGLTDININNFFAKTPDGFPKLQNITFQSFQMEANEENAQLFDQICSQRDSMRDAIGGVECDEDIWVPREIKFAEADDNDNRVIKKESHKTLTDSDSSSSSDDEENKDMNRITSYRGNTNGSSKPKSQRINNNEEFSNSDLNTDVQMELTNSTDFKAPSEDNNWADFGKFSNNQANTMQVVQTETIEDTKTESEKTKVKSNLSNDEDNNWANFDNFNEITNERCSSPNNSSGLMQTTSEPNISISTNTNDRSNAYLTNSQEQQALNSSTLSSSSITNSPTKIATDEITLSNTSNDKLKQSEQSTNSEGTPMESTNSVDER